jgi:hypothetical protein
VKTAVGQAPARVAAVAQSPDGLAPALSPSLGPLLPAQPAELASVKSTSLPGRVVQSTSELSSTGAVLLKPAARRSPPLLASVTADFAVGLTVDLASAERMGGLEPGTIVTAAPATAGTSGLPGGLPATLAPVSRSALPRVVNPSGTRAGVIDASSSVLPAAMPLSRLTGAAAVTNPFPRSLQGAHSPSASPLFALSGALGVVGESSAGLPAAKPIVLARADRMALDSQSSEIGPAPAAPVKAMPARPVASERAARSPIRGAVPRFQELGKAASVNATAAPLLQSLPQDGVRIPRPRPIASAPVQRAEPEKRQARRAAAVSKPKPTGEARPTVAEGKTKPTRQRGRGVADSKPKPTRPGRAESARSKAQAEAPARRKAPPPANQRARTAPTRQVPARQASPPARQAPAPARQAPARAQRPAALAPTRALPPSLLPSRPSR